MSFKNRILQAAIAVAGGIAASSYCGLLQAEERQLVIDVAGIPSVGIYSDGRNARFDYDLGADAQIIGIDWSVEIEAYAPAILSQAAVFFGHSEHRQLAINPGYGDDRSGIGSYADRRGDLVGDGLSFRVLADGILTVEFFSQFDYDELEYEGLWRSGSLTIDYEVAAVPEPQTYALLAAGLLTVAAVRRRQASQHFGRKDRT